MQSFSDLGVRAEISRAMAADGITTPFPIQALVLQDALAGRDICGKAQTGSGKTLAFAIPLVERLTWRRQRSPRALVLVPTRELATQVLEVVRPLANAAGLRVGAIYGGASIEKQISAARKGLDIVIATPGRLTDLVERRVLALDEVELAVVDEADRMADMGFLPQVEWILKRFRGQPQMLLFSATLDNQVSRLVQRYLHDPVTHDVAGDDVLITDMTHRFLAVHQMDRVKVVASIARSSRRTIVFVRTRRGADRLAVQLQREGISADAIHGNLRQSARERVLREFTGGRKMAVLVATDVAARGIHVDDVDVVVHYDLPEDHKAYVHRSGRTARAGKSGSVATLVLWNEVKTVERLQRQIGIREPIVETYSNDPRLAELGSLAEPAAIAG